VLARQLVPDGTGETIATLDYWFEPDRTEEQIEETIAWFEKIVGEDIPLCESVQVGLRSGFLERGVLHPEQERGPLAFQERVLACLAGTLA
jgi:phenylpropionate dioxygenase-like ring-hydroxylating dioxygenase large terminal subunit